MKRPFLFVALLFLAIAVFMLFSYINMRSNLADIDADSGEATARVVDAQRFLRHGDPTGYTEYVTYVSFAAQDGTAVRARATVPNPSSAHVGQEFRVIYSLSNPNNFYVYGTQGNSVGWMIIIIGIFVGISIVFAILHVKISNKKTGS